MWRIARPIMNSDVANRATDHELVEGDTFAMFIDIVELLECVTPGLVSGTGSGAFCVVAHAWLGSSSWLPA